MSRVTGDFEADLDEFLNTDEFAETVTYNANGQAATSIDVIFDSAAENINTQTLEIEASGPKVRCKTSDVENASNFDNLVIDGITFYVTRVEHDGTGMSDLYLSKRAAHK